jgi:hypothetical protein
MKPRVRRMRIFPYLWYVELREASRVHYHDTWQLALAEALAQSPATQPVTKADALA